MTTPTNALTALKLARSVVDDLAREHGIPAVEAADRRAMRDQPMTATESADYERMHAFAAAVFALATPAAVDDGQARSTAIDNPDMWLIQHWKDRAQKAEAALAAPALDAGVRHVGRVIQVFEAAREHCEHYQGFKMTSDEDQCTHRAHRGISSTCCCIDECPILLEETR